MRCRVSTVLGGIRRVGAAVSLTVVLVTASGRLGMAQSEDSSSGLAGTWMVQVTLRDCGTGAAIAAPVHSLVTFHRGGTLSESVGPTSFAPGQRSPGHGVWSHIGQGAYSHRMVNLINFDSGPNVPGTPGFDPTKPVSPGFFAGWQMVSHTIELTDADNLSSTGTNAFYKFDGTLYRTGCSTAIGRRFK